MARMIAQVPTTNASRYLQQLCKHWSHNLAVEFTPEEGSVVFPKSGRSGEWPDDGKLTLHAGPDALECRIEASVQEQANVLCQVVVDHLNRFAFREAPLRFDWQAG